MKKKVLSISLGWEQEPHLKRLMSMPDLELYGIHYTEDAVHASSFHERIHGDLRDLSTMLEFADRIQPSAVISDEDDYGILLAAFAAEKLGLPGPRVSEAQLGVNKYLQRCRALESGLVIPRFSLCKSADDVRRFISAHGSPVILKPIDSRGSIGASKITDESQASAAFYKAVSASPSLLAIVEEYIDGDHFNVDGYCFSGKGPSSLAVSANYKLAAADGLVNDSIVYGDVKSELRHVLLRAGEETARSLGYAFGFFHGEFIRKKSDGKIFLTEMANRGGGILISQVLLPFVTGLDLVGIYIGDCLGEKRDSHVSAAENFARIDFVTLEAGRIYGGLAEA
ncbi:MAG TPA: ATP-grasp domain-containing protein, partial [Leptospiraceae bacterium]|nr:ATP-grasp domain-containing protein [Leptospiraceae bacterium]